MENTSLTKRQINSIFYNELKYSLGLYAKKYKITEADQKKINKIARHIASQHQTFLNNKIRETSPNVVRDGRSYFFHTHMEILKELNIVDDNMRDWWFFTFLTDKGRDFFYVIRVVLERIQIKLQQKTI